MATELALAAAIFAALCLYFVLAGADFGGGVWDLLARGPRAERQRAAVAHAIGPVWEANHVWLILVVVLLFSGFPPAFAALSVALHVPLTLFLLGVVLRGAAFAFRGFDATGDRAQLRWGRLFSVASTISPLLLGMVVGALASGRIRVARDGLVSGGFFAPWLTPFSLALGVFALALCAFLAATYLTVELERADPELAEDFRRRALGAGVLVGVAAFAALALAGQGAPRVREGLAARAWRWPFHAATGLAALLALASLVRRRYRRARAAAVAQTLLVLGGWAASQYPFLVVPDVTLASAAANPQTRVLLLVALAVGAPVLVPSLAVLFRVFKAARRA
ncbi:MAG TPA: cytochrome d ubiquinol oxidase subunit II [Polyangia bacterium]|nr:cytochrome d ubiquinol oxidase subunit II [Polyangia bacterium]